MAAACASARRPTGPRPSSCPIAPRADEGILRRIPARRRKRTVTPIRRLFEEAATRGFCIGYPGCELEWEHRFEPRLPL
jgi:hypothetical protein